MCVCEFQHILDLHSRNVLTNFSRCRLMCPLGRGCVFVKTQFTVSHIEERNASASLRAHIRTFRKKQMDAHFSHTEYQCMLYLALPRLTLIMIQVVCSVAYVSLILFIYTGSCKRLTYLLRNEDSKVDAIRDS